MSAGSTEIGYLCHHGHYCFYADPTEGGQCGSKRVGTITLTFDDTDAPEDWTEIVSAAQASLAEKYETWRHCECSTVRKSTDKQGAPLTQLRVDETLGYEPQPWQRQRAAEWMELSEELGDLT